MYDRTVAQRLGYQIGEVPSTWSYQVTRRVKLGRDAWRSLDDLSTVRIAEWPGADPRRMHRSRFSKAQTQKQ